MESWLNKTSNMQKAVFLKKTVNLFVETVQTEWKPRDVLKILSLLAIYTTQLSWVTYCYTSA